MTKALFSDRNGNLSKVCINYYNTIKEYAERNELKNTLIALDLAVEMHAGQYRDSGEPYVIHPLATTWSLIILEVKESFINMYSFASRHEIALNKALKDLDILLAACLLHDVCEDCKEKVTNPDDFITVYHLHPDVLKYDLILKKDKSDPEYGTPAYDKRYHEGICEHLITILIKLADRLNNCSTIDVFPDYRKIKYIKETKQYFYTMTSELKNNYPTFSRQATLIKFQFVAICETVASALNVIDIITYEDPSKTYYFLKGKSDNSSMPDTFRALPLAKKYYRGLTRKSGDDFIIHPLRVCSFLTALNIYDDALLAAALLHEILKKCHLENNGIEIVTKHHLASEVLELIRLVSNSEHYPMEIYYKALSLNPKATLLRLSNRAHTCTTLMDCSKEELDSYVWECEEFIYPLCDYGIENYPEYANAIQIMKNHITATCRIAKSFKK